jgi:hypothetical protein
MRQVPDEMSDGCHESKAQADIESQSGAIAMRVYTSMLSPLHTSAPGLSSWPGAIIAT